MTNLNERQEVARRLRALPSDVYAEIGEWERDGLFIEANRSDEADYSQIHNALFGCFPADAMHPCDYEELHNRLADLIDPVCELDLDISMENIKCSACGKAIPHGTNPLEMKYCPSCGARVVSCND